MFSSPGGWQGKKGIFDIRNKLGIIVSTDGEVSIELLKTVKEG